MTTSAEKQAFFMRPTKNIFLRFLFLFFILLLFLSFFGQKRNFVFVRIFYELFPSQLEHAWKDVDMYAAARDDETIRYWLERAGPKKVMSKLVADAETPERGGWCHLPAHFVARMSHSLFKASPFDESIETRCQFGYYYGLIDTFISEQATTEVVARVFEHCRSLTRSRDRVRCM